MLSAHEELKGIRLLIHDVGSGQSGGAHRSHSHRGQEVAAVIGQPYHMFAGRPNTASIARGDRWQHSRSGSRIIGAVASSVCEAEATLDHRAIDRFSAPRTVRTVSTDSGQGRTAFLEKRTIRCPSLTTSRLSCSRPYRSPRVGAFHAVRSTRMGVSAYSRRSRRRLKQASLRSKARAQLSPQRPAFRYRHRIRHG
jgi:hypothetical protein